MLQTLDLPCPVCEASSPALAADGWTLHEYSKTFRTRHLVRPRVDRFIDELNGWLAGEPGLIDVHPVVHRDWHGIVKGATLTYVSSSQPQDIAFRLFRIPLVTGFGLKSVNLGVALNDWGDAYPRLERIRHQVWSSYGKPVECWLLASGSRADVVAVGPCERHREIGPRLRRAEYAKTILIAVVLLCLISLFATVTGSWPVVGPVALAASLWSARLLRRRRHRRR